MANYKARAGRFRSSTRNWRVALLAGAVLTALLTVLVAGSSGAASSKPASVATAASASRSSVALALPEEPRSLGSWDAFASDGQLLYNVEEPLVIFQPPKFKLTGVLATSWKQINPKTVQFRLRHGVKFQDGSPFNAQAAAYGINYVFSKKNAFEIREFVVGQVTAKAVGTYTLDVTSSTPDPLLAARMGFVLIPSMQQLKTDPSAYASHPIGTGPYTFVSWQRGQSIQLKANPNWWGLKAGQKLPIQTVNYTFNPEPEPRVAAVQSGTANVASLVQPQECKTSSTSVCLTAPDLNVVFVRFDYKNPLLKYKQIREAIALGMNVKEIAKKLVPGGVPRATVDPSFVSGADPSLKVYPYDLAKAKSLVRQAAAAGAPIKTPLKIVMKPGYVPNQDNIAAYLEQQLQAIGLHVSIHTYTQDQVEGGLVQHNYSPSRGWLLLWAHNTNIFDMSDFVNTYLSCPAGAFGDASGYCTPQLTKMIEKASTLYGKARAAAYKKIDDIAYNNYGVVAIASYADYYVVSPGLQWKPRQDLLILAKDMSWKK